MLENILIKYFNLPEDWNEDYTYAKVLWNESYRKLIDLMYSLETLGVLNADKICDCLDMISNMKEQYEE